MDEGPRCPAAVDVIVAAGTPMGNNVKNEPAMIESGRVSRDT
jgi:hypothetical protein